MDSWMYAPTGASAETRSSLDEQSPPNLSAIAAVQHGSPGAEHAQGRGAPRVRRRNRLITSCLECRRRKLKCDKLAPCTNCTRFKRDCLYLAPSMDPSSQQKLADLKEKMGALEKNLEREVASQAQKAHRGGSSITKATIPIKEEDDDDDDAAGGDEDEDALEPTPLAALDNVYDDNGDDELMDLGVQMGKMRITERIGGWFRPKLVDELNDTLHDVTEGTPDDSSSPKDTSNLGTRPSTVPRLQASPKSYIGPGPDYIAPSASFFFPGTNMNTTLVDYLPTKNAADQLIAQYWAAVHCICKVVHRPTFEAQYALFWGQIATGNEPVPPVQAVIFAAMLSAAVSMSNEQVLQRFGTSRNALVDSLRSGTEMALAKANFLRTTKVDTMQAFVMYLIPLIRAEVSRAHSALVGTAIRLAECMGLHRDGSLYNMTAVEVHVRRMIWHQLCFLDMKTCDATGPRPQIRKEDYDTKFPLNVDDIDLIGAHPPTEDKNTWTDNTFFRIRAEAGEMRRQIFYDIVQVDKKKKALTSVVLKVQKFILSCQEKFVPLINPAIPIQALGKLLLESSSKSLHIAVLHRYLFSSAHRMPDRLRQVLIESALVNMENSIAYETNPEMQVWVWYRGAFNVYHAALLLLIEVYAYPMRKEAPRIWKCLDYIFEVPAHLAPKQKAELILTDLRDRMEVYHQMRKSKISNDMEERISTAYAKRGSSSPMSMVDAAGQMRQNISIIPPANFSPPKAYSDSHSDGSRQGSAPIDPQMAAMEEIDWAEWDKVFNPEVNTGDLNIPDFNMADFTGDFNAPPMDPSSFNVGTAGALGATTDATSAANADYMANNFTFEIPTAQELENVQFTPTLIPDMTNGQQPTSSQQQTWRNYGYSGNEGGN